MKPRKLMAGIISIACIFFIFAGCGKSSSDVVNLIPEDASAAVIIPNVGATSGHVGEFIDWLTTQVPMLAMFKQQMSLVTGVDLTKAENLATKGIDPKGSAAVAALDPSGNKMTVLVPVKDEKAFVAFLNEMIRKKGGAELRKEGDNYTLPDGGVMSIKKGFAIMCENSDTIAKITGKGKSLASNPDYKRISKALGNSGDLIFYFSKKMMEVVPGPEAQEAAKLAKGFGALGGTLNISAKEISAKMFATIADTGNMKKLLSGTGESSLLESMPGPAPILARFNVNVPELWNYIKANVIASDPETKRQFEQGMTAMKASMNLDMEADVIANIAGDPIVVLYGMTGRKKDTPDIVITMVVKNEAKIRDAVSKISQMAGARKTPKDLKGMGVTVLSSPGGAYYIAVAKNNIVMTATPDRMKQVLGVLSGATSGQTAVGSVKHEEAKKLLQNKKSSVAYLSVFELLNSYRSSLSRGEQAMMDAYMTQAKGLANSYIIMTFSMEEGGVVSAFSLRFGG